MPHDLLHGEVTQKIIGVFYQVHWELGPGFLESVYVNSMALALVDVGLCVEREVPVAVFFRGQRVGTFRADLIVESAVLLELKASERLNPSCESQTINYLRATKLEVALVLHFGYKPTFKRFIATNNHKLIP